MEGEERREGKLQTVLPSVFHAFGVCIKKAALFSNCGERGGNK